MSSLFYFMLTLKGQKILIIAPHPDDEVLGAGGLIVRAKREGAKVYVLYMTVGTTKDFSKKGISTQDERINEMKKVASFLKLDGYKISLPGNEHHLRLDIVAQKKLIHEIERGEKISLQKIKPTMLITCHTQDYNQDHRAVGHASITATRPQPDGDKSLQRIVLAYEYPPSAWTDKETLPCPNVFVSIKQKDILAKMKAMKLYRSQLKNKNGALSLRAVKALAQIRGAQCGVEYAEAFFAKRLLT